MQSHWSQTLPMECVVESIASNVKRVTLEILATMVPCGVMLQEPGQIAHNASSTFAITAPIPSPMVKWISQRTLVNMELISRQLAILATTLLTQMEQWTVIQMEFSQINRSALEMSV